VLSSKSNPSRWFPWHVAIGDYSGMQDGGEIGVALKALLDAVN